MTKVSDSAADQIAQVAHTLGYETKIDPDKQSFVSELFLGRRFRPHILVKNGDRKTIVMATSRNVGLGYVNETRKYREKKEAGALICIPDWAFPHVGKDTKSYAKESNVRLCPLSEVGDALKELLD